MDEWVGVLAERAGKGGGKMFSYVGFVGMNECLDVILGVT